MTAPAQGLGLALVCWIAGLAFSCQAGDAAGSAAQGVDTAEPRTLVLVLDGLPHRVVERAVELGAFADWPTPSRLIAPFPSMTNVSLTLMFEPLGVGPVPGYELQHYDWSANEVHGGGAFEHQDKHAPWRAELDVTNRTLTGKFGTYARPLKHFRRDMDAAEQAVLHGEGDLVLAHVGATDAMQHLQGDHATLSVLFELEERLRALSERHQAERGRQLRMVLLSDHGNSQLKIRRLFQARKLLKKAGLRVRKRLEQPGDVVVGTFGVTGYAALYLHPDDAERGARALLGHRGVDLAAWQSGPGQLRVLSDSGDASVCWREQDRGRRLGYETLSGDPLWLSDTVTDLRGRGRLDAEGLATHEDWLVATAESPYPDALSRLVDGLSGEHVSNKATVLLSLRPGWGWGWKSAAVFAWFRGGALEGTHGGLDYDSSVGFFLTDDPELWPGPVTRPQQALASSSRSSTRAAQ